MARIKKIILVFFVSVLLSRCYLAYAAQALSVDSNTFNFSQPTRFDFDNGYIEAAQATTLTVNSDTDWVVKIETTNADLGGYGKPLSDFQWRKSGGAYQTITTSYADADTGSAGTNYIYIDYKMLLFWDRDEPWTYSLSLTYLLTTP